MLAMLRLPLCQGVSLLLGVWISPLLLTDGLGRMMIKSFQGSSQVILGSCLKLQWTVCKCSHYCPLPLGSWPHISQDSTEWNSWQTVGESQWSREGYPSDMNITTTFKQSFLQNFLFFWFINFLAYNALRILIFDIFKQPFPSDFENCPTF